MAWVSPTSRSTGNLITAAIWNQDVVDNPKQHQADLDLLYRRLMDPVIINGHFLVWQRGTSFASIATDTYTADRWLYRKSGAMVNTVSQSSVAISAAKIGYVPNSLRVAVTTTDTSIAAGDYCVIEQRIEGFAARVIARRGFALSFYVYSAKTGTHCVSFRNSGNDRSYVAEYTVNAANTWEHKTVHVTASPSAGTWDYTTGVGMAVSFVLTSGSTYQTTAGAWQTGNYFATSNQVNVNDSTSNNFYLYGIEVYPTDTATGISAADYDYFSTPSYALELARCMRYYIHWPTNDQGIGVGQMVTTSTSRIFVPTPVTMRAAPTATGEYACYVGRWNNTVVGQTSQTPTEITGYTLLPNGVYIQWTPSSSIANSDGQAVRMAVDNGAGEYFALSAEL